MKSATDVGREILNKAFDLKMVMHKDKISFKFVACGNEYFVVAPQDLLAEPKGAEQIWINLFQEFEKDLDAGVHERKERIIKPETKLIL